MQPQKQIRALYTEDYVRVYQAYNRQIARDAVRHGRFVASSFKMERTTWIKPSFCWMMYRCGWATKENQEHVLAIDISHEGFKWALEHAALSHFEADVHASLEEWRRQKEGAEVVVQWDPERDLWLRKLDWRSIQIGLTPPAAKRYVGEWILHITDVTELATEIKAHMDRGEESKAEALLPVERVYAPVEFIANINRVLA